MSELKMPDINNILIAGVLVDDPIIKQREDGTPMVHFHITSARKYRDNSGIWRENVCHVGVIAGNKLAQICYENLKKNSSIMLDGELISQNVQQEEVSNRNVVEVYARRIQFLDQKTPQATQGLVVENTETEEPSLPEASPAQDKHVDPTDYDFGYQDLKI